MMRFLLCCSLLVAVGCGPRPRSPKAPDTNLPGQALNIQATGERIRKKAIDISKMALQAGMLNIAPQFALIGAAAVDIVAEVDTLYTQACEVAAVQDQIDDLTAKLDKAEKALHGNQEKLWFWLMGAGALLIVAALPVGYVFGIKAGLMLAATGMVAIGVGNFMQDWAWLMGLIIALALVGVLALVAREVLKRKRQMLELVRSGEEMKKHIPGWSDGTDDAEKIQQAVGQHQDADTQDEVRRLRLEDRLTKSVG